MKKYKFAGVILSALIIVSFFYYLFNRFSHSKQLPFFDIIGGDKDSVLTIGIIGDSWVADNALDSSIHFGLLQKGINNRVISSGHPGAKSKLVYQNLFKGVGEENSSKFVIENNPHFCIVIAGVNDAASQMGAKFYSYHMKQIINTLIHYKIKPIIITLPEFGVKETIAEMDILKRSRNILSAYINNKGEIDNIKTYRKNFNQELEISNLRDKIILVNFDNVCKVYEIGSELYEDHSHLSKNGNIVLSEVIVNELIKNISELMN